LSAVAPSTNPAQGLWQSEHSARLANLQIISRGSPEAASLLASAR
jgi:hypothetical protein